MKTILLHKCLIIKNIPITKDIYKISFKSPDIALNSSPGQFLQLRITENLDPFLRRPFSISRVDKKRGIIDILYKVIGRGTELMTHSKNNNLIDVVGPLGNSFDIEGDFQKALIVAGGIGCAPVFYLIDELIEKNKNIKLIFGSKTRKQLIDFNEYGNKIDVSICTEDGSCGTKGLVTDIILKEIPDSSGSVQGFACGPNPMYKVIQDLFSVSKSIPWQVSMESRMACGTGVCQGCAIKMKTNGYKLVCSQGPVFNLKDINFNG